MRTGRGGRRRVPGSLIVMWGGAGVAAGLFLVLLGLGLGSGAVWMAGVALLVVCIASCARLWIVDRKAERDLHRQIENLKGRRGEDRSR